MTDMVNNPAHYIGHPIFTGECWDYSQELENGAEFSVFRYAWRWRKKFDPLEDLNKAGWYLDRLLERYQDNRGEVNSTRTRHGRHLTNTLDKWREDTLVRYRVVGDEWAALVNINVMLGNYREAANYLDEVTNAVKEAEDPPSYPMV